MTKYKIVALERASGEVHYRIREYSWWIFWEWHEIWPIRSFGREIFESRDYAKTLALVADLQKAEIEGERAARRERIVKKTVITP